MTVRLLAGDCRVTLPTLAEKSAQSCITSPPYYGLRDYGTPPLVWGQTCCDHPHEWGVEQRAPWANELPSAKSETKRNNAFHESMGKTAGQFCQHVHEWEMVVKPAANGIVASAMQGETLNGTSGTRKPTSSGLCACGAWLGSLGLEPTPDLYIEHLVECFRHVWRVLRDDGVCFLNLGDSYAGSGKGPTGWNGIGDQVTRQGFKNASFNQRWNPNWSAETQQNHQPDRGAVPGLKPKDLLMMPFRVAMALQADGWWLRSVIPWLKRNAMPESVTDRPATSVEYVFLLAKSARYYWDADAVRVAQGNNTHSRGNGHTPKERPMGEGIKANSSFHAATNGVVVPGGRSRRNSDWFFESWQGLLLDEQDDPLACVVNPQPFSGAHFATFSAKLVEPMIRASTRPGDTILDPFGGAGTVGLVADRMGRNAVLCELKSDYAAMGAERIVGDNPMFTEVAAD